MRKKTLPEPLARETFRCVPLRATVSRGACASRYAANHKDRGAGQRQTPYHDCATCPVGKTHDRAGVAASTWPDGTPIVLLAPSAPPPWWRGAPMKPATTRLPPRATVTKVDARPMAAASRASVARTKARAVAVARLEPPRKPVVAVRPTSPGRKGFACLGGCGTTIPRRTTHGGQPLRCPPCALAARRASKAASKARHRKPPEAAGVTVAGRTQSVAAWARELGVTPHGLYYRRKVLGSYEAAVAAGHRMGQ